MTHLQLKIFRNTVFGASSNVQFQVQEVIIVAREKSDCSLFQIHIGNCQVTVQRCPLNCKGAKGFLEIKTVVAATIKIYAGRANIVLRRKPWMSLICRKEIER